MKAMVINRICSLAEESNPLNLRQLDKPEPSENEILIKVNTCGVCHTEMDEIEGRTPPPDLPVVPGHQVVGVVEKSHPGSDLKPGDRVGVAWIFSSCGTCKYCKSGQENLCPEFKATGRDAHGGYAEYMTVPSRFAYKIPDSINDVEAAPLLCGGAIGYRALRLCRLKNGASLGLMGFGSSNHQVLKIAMYLYPESRIFVFTRNKDEQEFAKELGACWAGDIEDTSPEKLRAVLDSTPVWKPVVESLKNLEPGGRLVVNAIRKESFDQDYLQKLNYSEHLWMEKEIKSVANITRKDVAEFLELAAKIPLRPETQTYPLEEANKALSEMKRGIIRGAKVLTIDENS